MIIDPFVAITPVLLLPVVALLRFVGCATVLGLDKFTYASLSGTTSFVTGFTPPAGAPRHDNGGMAGMALTMNQNVTVKALGRSLALGITQSHQVLLVDAGTQASVAMATVDGNSSVSGQFSYQLLDAPITLASGGQYYLVSTESGVDPYYDAGGVVSVTSVGEVTGSVENTAGPYKLTNAGPKSYGLPNFWYT